jgi:transcriptional regulator with XRE-family HTH domain
VSDPVPKKQANSVDAQVGNRVRLRRMLVGMSQEKLGELLGLTFQQVQKYEKGVNRIGAGRLYHVAQILGVSVSYFYEDVPEQNSLASTAANDRATPSAVEFLSSNEGMQLTLAFMRIREPKVRRRVIDLVKSLADGESETQNQNQNVASA